MSSDPYKILGIKSGASVEEIRKAYQRLAMKHHPDRNDGNDEKFKEVQAAYEKVKDGATKWKGPNFDKASATHGGFGFDFKTREDIAEFLRKHRFDEFATVSVTAEIPLKDAVIGGEQFMAIPHGGKTVNVKVTVPAGLEDGSSIKYPRLVNGADAVIKFNIKPDPVWEVDDLNLIRHSDISIWDLILGCALDVETITGSVIRLKIPAGTQPGTHMRIKGRGITTRGGRVLIAHGDMLVCLDGKIPKDIPASILNAIREESG